MGFSSPASGAQSAVAAGTDAGQLDAWLAIAADGTVVRDLINPTLKEKTPASHPGWVYQLRFTSDGKHLVSVGDMRINKGYLAVWNMADGKLLYGEGLPMGSFFALAISPDDRLLAIGAGPRGRPTAEFNHTYIMKMPVK